MSPHDKAKYNAEYIPFHTNTQGYEKWETTAYHGKEQMLVHRLLAIAEYGFDAVGGSIVHHKNEIRWDNRVENIELKNNRREHRLHHEESEYGDKPWRDKELLRHLYHDKGLNTVEIAERFGCSQPNITRWMNHYDIQVDGRAKETDDPTYTPKQT